MCVVLVLLARVLLCFGAVFVSFTSSSYFFVFVAALQTPNLGHMTCSDPHNACKTVSLSGPTLPRHVGVSVFSPRPFLFKQYLNCEARA